jgi:hypothetical protein
VYSPFILKGRRNIPMAVKELTELTLTDLFKEYNNI